MKKYLLVIIGLILLAGIVEAAPVSTILRNILPEANNSYDIGSTTPSAGWKNVYTYGLTLVGFDCTGYTNNGKLTVDANGVVSCANDLSGGGSGGSSDFNYTVATGGTYLTPTTTTVGILTGPNASSTIQRLTSVYSTSTRATTSVFAVTGHSTLTTLNVSGAATLPGGVTITCTSCITDTNVSDTLTASDLVSGSSVVSDAEVDDNITLTNITQITTRAITDLTGTLTVGNGGTGAITFTANGVLYGNSTGAIQVTAACSNGEILKWSGGIPACGTDSTGGGGGGADFGKTFELNAANSLGQISLAPTTTVGLLITSASSTFQGLFAKNSTSTNATSTTLNVSGQIDFDLLTSALVLTGAGGILAEYTGTSCTNQFPRSLSALGAATCASVANTDLTNSTISGIALGSNLADLTATNGTLTFSGTYNGSTARTIGLNLANPNTWTGVQTINNLISTLSTSTHATTTGTQDVGALRINSQHFTNLLGSGLVNTAGVLTPDCATITGGAGLCDGVDADSGAGTGSNWSFESQFAIRPTSTAVGILTTASSTLNRLFARYATTTEATTTQLRVEENLLVNNFFQDGFTTGCTGDEGETVLYNASTGQFTCGTDGGGSAPVQTVWESKIFDTCSPQVTSTTFAPGGAFFDYAGEYPAIHMLNATSSRILCTVHIPKSAATSTLATVFTVFSATTTGNGILDTYASTTNPSYLGGASAGGIYGTIFGAGTIVIKNASSTAANRLDFAAATTNFLGIATTSALSSINIIPDQDLIVIIERSGANANDTVSNGIFFFDKASGIQFLNNVN